MLEAGQGEQLAPPPEEATPYEHQPGVVRAANGEIIRRGNGLNYRPFHTPEEST